MLQKLYVRKYYNLLACYAKDYLAAIKHRINKTNNIPKNKNFKSNLF
jgi:hypothetical protein